jgi:hypothetical protein
MVRANKRDTKSTKEKPYGTSKDTNKRPMTGQFREKKHWNKRGDGTPLI